MCAAEDTGNGKKGSGLRLLSRSARQWKSLHAENAKAVPVWFERDFSKVTTAADYADAWLIMGKAVAVLPDRLGVSGTYFITDSEAHVLAVFKPIDEEAGQESNPIEGDLIDQCSSAFVLGECAYKEAAAYLLDHRGMAGVPQTVIVNCKTLITSGLGASPNKTGAFQVYQENIGDLDDFGPGLFSVEDVQRIAAFDIRILNCDRHGGNLLVTKRQDGTHTLVPIDHGYTLPDRIVTPSFPIWMHWPQCRQPTSSALKTYIMSLDSDLDVSMLQDELGEKINPGSLRTYRILSALLKKAMMLDMSLYAIGMLIFHSGSDPNMKSILEKICDEAYEAGLVRERRIDSQLDLSNLDGAFDRDRCLRPSTEDFIVRYASKLMDARLQTLTGFGCISRARSNPNFVAELLLHRKTSTAKAKLPPEMVCWSSDSNSELSLRQNVPRKSSRGRNESGGRNPQLLKPCNQMKD